MTRYKDATGNTLRHANYLPLTEGIDIDMGLEVHTFTWNVFYDTFNFETDIAPYIGTINSTAMPRLKDASIKHVLLESCTCTENFRTVNIGMPNGQVGQGVETKHFITLTATFVVDRRSGYATPPVEPPPVVDSPEGYFREANRRVSMHTLERSPVLGGGFALTPIPVNARGDVAQAPWPLAPSGIGVPYDLLDSVDPDTDYAIIDPLLPLESDLAAFTVTHKLEVP